MTQTRQTTIRRYFDNLHQAGITPWKDHAPEPSLSDFLTLLKQEKPHANILDIGCGDGWISFIAARRSFEVWGLDGSETAIKRAQITAIQEGLANKTHFRVGDALDLPYEDDFFDAAIDRALFHHILPENRQSYKENILRVLKNDACIYLAVFSMNNPEGIGQRFTKEDIQTIFRSDFLITHYEADPYPTDNPAHLIHFILKRSG